MSAEQLDSQHFSIDSTECSDVLSIFYISINNGQLLVDCFEQFTSLFFVFMCVGEWERSWVPVESICICSEVPSDVVENGKCVLVPACGCASVCCVCVYCVYTVRIKTSPSQLCLTLFSFVPSPPDIQTGTQAPSGIYPSSIAPWAASCPATGPWSWSTCFCCKFRPLRCRELILCPRNYDDSMNRSVWISVYLCVHEQ